MPTSETNPAVASFLLRICWIFDETSRLKAGQFLFCAPVSRPPLFLKLNRFFTMTLKLSQSPRKEIYCRKIRSNLIFLRLVWPTFGGGPEKEGLQICLTRCQPVMVCECSSYFSLSNNKLSVSKDEFTLEAEDWSLSNGRHYLTLIMRLLTKLGCSYHHYHYFSVLPVRCIASLAP